MTADPADERHLRRAIRLAMNGRGHVEPNPMVGCVIVKDGRVIGQGHHARFGGPHAEPSALAACTDSPAGATAYVTLEPCCHTDKKTPPCAPLLVREGIARVVVGCLDPNPQVNGNGVRLLRDAGVRVHGPVLEAECKQLIAPFLKRLRTGRSPYVSLKWAESADAKVAGEGGRPVRISSPGAWREVHRMRSRSDSIVVGIGTVLADDPLLTPRDVPPIRVPCRVILDTHLRTPLSARVVTTARQFATQVWCGTDALRSGKADDLRAAGIVVDDLDSCPDPRASGPLSLGEMIFATGGSHQFVEPGPTLARGYLDRNLADRVWIIRSPRPIDAASAPTAARLPSHFVETGTAVLDGDQLTEYLNPRSPDYFAAVPSADLVLARP